MIALLAIFLLPVCQPWNTCIWLPGLHSNYVYAEADVTGLVTDEFGIPMDSGIIRLAEVYCNEWGECAAALDLAWSPAGWVGEGGGFTIEQVSVRKYVIVYVIGDLDKSFQVICEPGTKNPRVWLPEAGAVLDVGTLAVWRDWRDNQTSWDWRE